MIVWSSSWILSAFFGFTTGLLVLFTLLPLSRASVWWVRDLDFPRMQLAVASVALVLCILVFSGSIDLFTLTCVVLCLSCLAYHIWWILPYSTIFPIQVPWAHNFDPDRSISILSSNVLTPNKHSQSLVDLVHKHKPDILVTLETDGWWESQLTVLEEEYTHTVKCPQDNLYGMHVYSKLVLSEIQTEFLIEDDVPSMHFTAIMHSGEKIRIHILHPAPPSPTENETSSERDVELIVVAKKLADQKVPVIVTGDLNDVAWSRTTRIFRRLSGLQDPRIGRGMFNTFHAEYWFLRWPLDHIFHSKHFALKDMKRLKLVGSDHFALFSHLSYEIETDHGSEPESLDVDEKELVKERLEEFSISDVDIDNVTIR